MVVLLLYCFLCASALLVRSDCFLAALLALPIYASFFFAAECPEQSLALHTYEMGLLSLFCHR